MIPEINVTDRSGDRKYFCIIPYYILHNSTAHQQSLYLCLKRFCGEEGTCWAAPATIGKMMGVSSNTVRKNLEQLVRRGWIRKIGKRGKTKPTDEYMIVDVWRQNFETFSQTDRSKKIVQQVNNLSRQMSAQHGRKIRESSPGEPKKKQ